MYRACFLHRKSKSTAGFQRQIFGKGEMIAGCVVFEQGVQTRRTHTQARGLLGNHLPINLKNRLRVVNSASNFEAQKFIPKMDQSL